MDKTVPHFDVLPTHIGFIMDGNGRWATKRGLPRGEGHKAGAKAFKRIGEYCADVGIRYMTFYAFSTENWHRPQQEVAGLMELFEEYLNDGELRLDENKEKQMRLHFIGGREGLPAALLKLIDRAEAETARYDRVHVNIALNYGGRDELVRAVRKIAGSVAAGELETSQITEQTIADNLFTAGQPDPDIIVRPSGEYRLSNFLTWQSAYSELWFADILWPDFSERDVDRVIEDYGKRNRRFGGV